VNDPTTAVQVLDPLGGTLRLLASTSGAAEPDPFGGRRFHAIDMRSAGSHARIERSDDPSTDGRTDGVAVVS